VVVVVVVVLISDCALVSATSEAITLGFTKCSTITSSTVSGSSP